jgi:hypothetical protein
MIPLDPESEKVLNFFYLNISSFTGIGVNQIREHFQFSKERIDFIIEQLKTSRFITETPDLPEGTLSINAPNNFTPGKFYKITQRGIDYIQKQGEFKETITNISTQTINNSPKSQIMTDSLHGRQNIGSRNESIISKIIKLLRGLLRL